ncbi:pre-60S ribosomal particles component [Exophiala xenobiotica]|uniref:Pre-60S ribosomal particles component n=1 Tax=Lithohypha guttulata TaxID=1690604 RepID=A0ABR0KC03_9EURO|nr:pre-60S ribosomal particles component [Lithohypha guttulata]KAK5319378.1 pre-60S ribosomal particles component [Exophiala xenobiotica]
MSRITPVSAKKRKIDEAMRGKTSKPRKRIRKQKHYHSSSSEDEAASDQDVGFAPVNLGDSDGEEAQVVEPAAGKKRKTQKKQIASDAPVELKAEASRKRVEDDDNEADGGSSSEEVATSNVELVGPQEDTTSASHRQSSSNEDDETASDDQSSASETSSTTNPNHTKPRTKSKRNDPTAFSTSISKILATKLPTSQRTDPVLSRSASAAQSRTDATNLRLEARATSKLRAEKRAALQKGRTTDVLGIERGIAGEVAEKEKQLRKIATRGVIQLFNAFRGAHERAEEARREQRKVGTVGIGERERKVGEVSKEGFLELIGGKKKEKGVGET